MKNILFALIAIFGLNGCIVFKSVSYEISLSGDISGNSLVIIEDISSDAQNEEDFNNDIQFVFDYAQVSSQFIDDMNNEGKKIISRKLFIQDGKLNALVSYEFDYITLIESIYFDDPYYYLNLAPEDSIISTNGQIFSYDDFKRIVWDKSMKTLNFHIFSENTDNPNIKSLAPFYKK
jgi:hypothetical protein